MPRTFLRAVATASMLIHAGKNPGASPNDPEGAHDADSGRTRRGVGVHPVSSQFHSLYRHDFVRLAACVPRTEVGDPDFNFVETMRLAARGDAAKAALMVFPELGLSSYAIEDLLFQDALLRAVERRIGQLVEASQRLFPVLIVGAPLRTHGQLYNAPLVLHHGGVLAVVPKAYLPNYRGFYERRHFTAGAGIHGRRISVAGREAPFGIDLLFRSSGSADLTFHVEICEDIWVPLPPSTSAALAGAEVLVNLSASNITIGKAETRRLLCASQSARAIAAYMYSAAGPGESTTDLAWDGHAAIFEYCDRLAETERFPKDSALILADVDLGRIRQERMQVNTFGDCAGQEAERIARFRTIPFELDAPETVVPLERAVERFPYVPSDPHRLQDDCYEAYNIQVQGLAKRLEATAIERAVIGLSGGLDSTQAAIVAARAMDRLGRPRANVLAYTLPGFATSEHTKANAWALITALGLTGAEIDIRPAARQMLGDLGHPFSRGEPAYDVTFENVQAGLRTDYLFRLANQNRALVVGTGDLSELALGWCTYGVGDHMSHYNVNASVPKTLITHLVRWVAETGQIGHSGSDVLVNILNTDISPELVPGKSSGDPEQKTESVIGPYELQDFNLYYTLRFGFTPSKVAFLAYTAWKDRDAGAWPEGAHVARNQYALPAIKHNLGIFLDRFFRT